jgi:hypothetical protein
MLYNSKNIIKINNVGQSTISWKKSVHFVSPKYKSPVILYNLIQRIII